MQAPKSYRKKIPLFYEKTALEYQKDPYERYYPMVLRQTALHLADELWGSYPFQPILDWASTLNALVGVEATQILEVGCGVGRWIANYAQAYPNANCWGIDYSYQLLKRASEYWLEGKIIHIDERKKGFAATLDLQGHQLSNLHLGLAKASALPFVSNSQDLVLSSFLIDRLDDPKQALEEWFRVLKPTGKLLLISPLNFQKTSHWEQFYPVAKLSFLLEQIGFSILDWQDDIVLQEPLDARGNGVSWKCLGVVALKLGD